MNHLIYTKETEFNDKPPPLARPFSVKCPIDQNSVTPVYFFCAQRRQVLEGRFFRISSVGNIIVLTKNDGTFFSEGDHYKFTNNYKEAKRDGVKFFKSEIADKRRELKEAYNSLFKLKFKGKGPNK